MMNREIFEESLIQPLQFWSMKSKNEVRALLGEEVAQMVDYDQRNPHHCYDLFCMCCTRFNLSVATLPLLYSLPLSFMT